MPNDVYATAGTCVMGGSNPSLQRLGSFLFELRFDPPERQTVHYIVFGLPAFAGDANPDRQLLRAPRPVRVWIDAAFNTFWFCERPPTPIKIESFWCRIQF